jgi:UPF0716 protein FxsA
MRFLLLIFVVLPVIEMWLLIQVGSVIGALPTIFLVLLMAVGGVVLLRRQGLNTLIRGNQKLESGQLPAQEMVEALILAVSGVLLVIPGFCTDFFGILGLIPPLRRGLARRMMAAGFVQGGFQAAAFGPGAPFRRGPVTREDRVIEGEFWRKDRRD